MLICPEGSEEIPVGREHRGDVRMSQVLLVYLSGEYVDSDVAMVRAAVEELAQSRHWTVSPPEFVDATDSSSCTAPEDEPIRTVGGALAVTEPGETPSTPRSEVDAFIDGMALLSKAR